MIYKFTQNVVYRQNSPRFNIKGFLVFNIRRVDKGTKSIRKCLLIYTFYHNLYFWDLTFWKLCFKVKMAYFRQIFFQTNYYFLKTTILKGRKIVRMFAKNAYTTHFITANVHIFRLPISYTTRISDVQAL